MDKQSTAINWIRKQEEVVEVSSVANTSLRQFLSLDRKTRYYVGPAGDIQVIRTIRFEEINLPN